MDELTTRKMYEELMNTEAMSKMFQHSQFNDPEETETFVSTKELVEENNGKPIRYNHEEEPEVLHFKKYSQRRQHKYTQQEMDAMRKSCENTIVHDYGHFDWYHVSDEERAKNDELAEISLKLAKVRSSYRRVDQYIEAMRTVYQAWEILSKMNYIHTKKEFFKLVAKGNIVSNRIIMPKLKSKKSYNLDLICKYISNPNMDISHLAPKKTNFNMHDIFLPDDEIETNEETMKRLLSPKEVEYALDHADNPEPMRVDFIKQKEIKGYTNKNPKKKKNESKKQFNKRKDLYQILNKIENSSHYKDWTNSYMITNSLFEKNKEEVDFWDKIPFTGSWTKKKDSKLYDIATYLTMLEQTPPREKYMTYREQKLSEIFRSMEDNGISTIDFRRRLADNGISTERMKMKNAKKNNRKLEAAIIKRIEGLNKSKEFRKITKKAEEALSKYSKEE